MGSGCDEGAVYIITHNMRCHWYRLVLSGRNLPSACLLNESCQVSAIADLLDNVDIPVNHNLMLTIYKQLKPEIVGYSGDFDLFSKVQCSQQVQVVDPGPPHAPF